MKRTPFQFKQFSVFHDQCAMKVGTDAVLLGAWVNATSAKKILDIGTGTGVIGLMLAQKTDAEITAIDIDEGAYNQAKENVTNSKWKNQVELHHCSLQEYVTRSTEKYNTIVTNPPYFIDSYKSPKIARTNARHTDQLSFQDLIVGVLALLSEKGCFYAILPVEEGEHFIKLAAEQGLHLSQLSEVIPRTGKPIKRYLMKFERTKKTIQKDSITIELDARHEYTEAYKQLTKDYYLAF